METNTSNDYVQKAIPRTEQYQEQIRKRLQEVEIQICRLETEALNLRVYLYGSTNA